MRILVVLASFWLALNPASSTRALVQTQVHYDPLALLDHHTLPDLSDASISDLQACLSNGTFTSAALTRAYLARSAEVNGELRAVLETNPRALAWAELADAERALGRVRSPLHGIPVLVKDNIATLAEDGNTTAGSYALLDSVTGYESTVVRKLKEAGAIVLGKTNMCEWASARGMGVPIGWSARGGRTTNPYYPGGCASGSSGGSAVAAPVGLAAGTLGTQTMGSIISPASRNNLVGLKPTMGRTSRFGVVPVSRTMDSVGPLVRTVEDAAIIMQAIAGPDEHDVDTLRQPSPIPDFTAHLRPDFLRGKRIGIVRRGFTHSFDDFGKPGFRPPNRTIQAYNWSVGMLEELGAVLVDPADFLELEQFFDTIDTYHGWLDTLDYKDDMANYLESLASSPVRSMTDLVAFNNAHPELEFPDKTYTQSGLIAAAASDGRSNATYAETKRIWHQRTFHATFEASLRKHNVSAFIVPTEPAASVLDSPFQAPAITVPLGFLPEDALPGPDADRCADFPGQPFGLTFLGPKWSEVELLGFAYAFEQATQVRSRRRPYDEAMPKAGIEL